MCVEALIIYHFNPSYEKFIVFPPQKAFLTREKKKHQKIIIVNPFMKMISFMIHYDVRMHVYV